MSTKKITPATPKQPALPKTIIQEDWKKAVVKYSDKWADDATGKLGSCYYAIQTGQNDKSTASFETDDGASLSIGYERVFFAKPEERDNLPKIRFNGGKPVYNKMKEKMPIIYVNCNRSYKGVFYMSEARYNKYIKNGHVALPVDTMQSLTSALPS